MRLMQRFRDWRHEQRIAEKFHELQRAQSWDHELRVRLWKEFSALVEQRSVEQVRRIERAKGLRA